MTVLITTSNTSWVDPVGAFHYPYGMNEVYADVPTISKPSVIEETLEAWQERRKAKVMSSVKNKVALRIASA